VGQARASQLRVASVTLTEHLAPGAGYVVGSADPPVTAGDGQQGFLTWRFSLLERQEQDLSYAVAPTVPGNALVARLGYLVFTDTHGRSGNTTLPPRGVLVAGERIWTTTLPLAFCCQPSIDP